MIKVENGLVALGQLRDIRLSGFKQIARPQNGYGARNGAPESSEDSLQAKERAAYQRGRQDAEEQSAKRMNQLRQELDGSQQARAIELMTELNRTVNGQLGEMFKALEKHVVMLAAEAAIKLTAGIPISADLIEANVRETMSLVEQETEVAVRLHPEDLALLEKHQSGLLNRPDSSPILRLRPDPKVSRGGCILETKFGELDARRETKIELLKRAVNE